MATTKRVLAAPHQNRKTSNLKKRGSNNHGNDEVSLGYLKARDGWKFPPLEDEHLVQKTNYIGPTPESNWVIPGTLLVGAYPCSNDDTETFELLTGILKCRVNTFVCLQLEYPAAHVTEE